MQVEYQRSLFAKWLFGFWLVSLAVPALAQTNSPKVIVFDSYMTPAAGAQNLMTIQQALASLEDRWIPRAFGDERSRPAHALGILYRTGKFLALDMPQDHLLMVTAHEVFGHGSRFRELGDGRIGYGFDAPIPYGSGDAFTKFNGRFPASPLAHLAAASSGIEGQHALADAIAARAIDRGRLHYREAWLYFESRLTGMTYILSASPHSADGHDVADFLETHADACALPCTPLTRRRLQRRALLALGDPLLFYALYGFAGAYIGNGSTTGPVPMIPIGLGMRGLPSIGYALAPYGAEWTTRLAVTREQSAESDGQQVTSQGPTVREIRLRVGETGASTTWGVSVQASDVLRLKGLPVDAVFNIWRQPDVFADQTSDPLHTGVEAAGTVTLPFPRWLAIPFSSGISVIAGYKTRGYVPGEQLSRGLVFRTGIQVR